MSILRIKGDDGVIIDSQKFLELPKSPTATSTGINRVGMMRYNIALSAFEGVIQFTDGTVGYRRFPNLDQNGRLLTSQLPDSITSGLKYAGTFNPVTDDIDPPSTPGVYTALPSVSGSAGQYFIVRGIFDLAAKHFSTNSPSTSPVTFTPVNPNGSVNWLEIKYYFTSTGVVSAFGRIIATNVNAQAHPGLTLLGADTSLRTFAGSQNAETALSDGDWIVNSGTTWQRLRQTRISILAGAVQVDNSRVIASGRAISGSDTGTVQAYIDGLTVGTVRRGGDSLMADGSSANGRLAFTYGTAAAPAITFNNTSFNPDNSSGLDASLWSDASTGIFHPGAGLISFSSSGTERFRISGTGAVLYQAAGINTATSAAFQLNSSTNTNVIGFTGYNNKLYMTVGGKAQGVLDDTGLTILGVVNSTGATFTGNTVLGATATDTLKINSTSTFSGPSTFDGTLAANGNVTLGDTAADTLVVSSVSTFNSLVTFGGNVNIAGTASLNGNVNIGDASTDIVSIKGVSTFSANSTFNGNLVANGNITLGDAATDVITVNGTMTFAATAPVTMNGNLTVKGNTVLGDALADTLTVTATSSFVSPVVFADSVALNGNVIVGDALADKLTVSASSTFASPVVMNDLVTMNGNVTLGDDSTDIVTVNAKSTFASLASFDGEVTLNDKVALNDKVTIGVDETDILTVESTSTFNAATFFSSEVGLNDKVTIGVDSTDILSVNSESTFTGKTTFVGEVVFSDKVAIGNVSVSSFDTDVTFDESVTIKGNTNIGTDDTNTVNVLGTMNVAKPATFTDSISLTGTSTAVISKLDKNLSITLADNTEDFSVLGGSTSLFSVGSYGLSLPVVDTTTAPATKVGVLAYDETKKTVLLSDGTEWKNIAGSTEPEVPEPGEVEVGSGTITAVFFMNSWATNTDGTIGSGALLSGIKDASVYETIGDGIYRKRNDATITIYATRVAFSFPTSVTPFAGKFIVYK